jgi:hypothetical protein
MPKNAVKSDRNVSKKGNLIISKYIIIIGLIYSIVFVSIFYYFNLKMSNFVISIGILNFLRINLILYIIILLSICVFLFGLGSYYIDSNQ